LGFDLSDPSWTETFLKYQNLIVFALPYSVSGEIQAGDREAAKNYLSVPVVEIHCCSGKGDAKSATHGGKPMLAKDANKTPKRRSIGHPHISRRARSILALVAEVPMYPIQSTCSFHIEYWPK
jgi:hypothetical protein